jgi:hypothetical protein
LRSAATGDGASSAVLIRGLRKQYETGKVALHDLWLAIEKGECFGLLGGCQSLPLVARMFRRTRAMRATDRPPFGAAMERAVLGQAARRRPNGLWCADVTPSMDGWAGSSCRNIR